MKIIHQRQTKNLISINQSEDKMNLLKTLNSKQLKKSCSRFLSSIVTLSVLSIANSTFAFPVRIKEAPVNLYFYNRPPEFDGQKVLGRINVDNSKLDIKFCQLRENWCYVEGLYFLREGGFKSIPSWVQRSKLCDDPSTNIPFLPTCSWSGRGSSTQFIRQEEPVLNPEEQIVRYYCEGEIGSSFFNLSDLLSDVLMNVGFQQIPSSQQVSQQVLNLYPECQRLPQGVVQ